MATDTDTGADDSGFSEKELLLFVLTGIALMMMVSAFVLVLSA
jgi:hypothetical protein